MTLIAGFKCRDGAVLCADTQLTVAGALKFPESKIRLFVKHTERRLFFAYTGYDDFSLMCIDELTKKIALLPKGADVVKGVKETCKEIHKEYYPLYKSPYKLGLELCFAIHLEKWGTRLFYIRGPVVSPITSFRCGGAGLYLGHAIARSLYASDMTVEEGGRMAAYVLYQAKNHVDGVGGASQIVRIRDRGGWSSMLKTETEFLETVYAEYLEASRPVLLAYGDWAERPAIERFEKELRNMTERLVNKRKEMDAVYSKYYSEMAEAQAQDNWGYDEEEEQSPPDEEI